MVVGKTRRALVTADSNGALRTRAFRLNQRSPGNFGLKTQPKDLRRMLSQRQVSSDGVHQNLRADLRHTLQNKPRSNVPASVLGMRKGSLDVSPLKILVSKDLTSKRTEYMRVPRNFSAAPVTVTIQNDLPNKKDIMKRRRRTPQQDLVQLKNNVQRPPKIEAKHKLLSPIISETNRRTQKTVIRPPPPFSFSDYSMPTVEQNLKNQQQHQLKLHQQSQQQMHQQQQLVNCLNTRKVGSIFDGSSSLHFLQPAVTASTYPDQKMHKNLNSITSFGNISNSVQPQIQNISTDSQLCSSVIRVSNLHRGTTIDDLRSAFSVFGPIEDVFLFPSASGSSSGVALIAFPSKTSCQNAINEYDDEVIDGLVVKIEHYVMPTENGRPVTSVPLKRAGFLGAGILPSYRE